ncbi:LamB/YcsF family protein [Leucobacter massiliensis]|uniref:5-oxoprolinase subunit A n=1 Tax=Leucobacter massiliensis TaxID=1686285 RepID=A0A2S9QP21_9MICO|nr:5-oxoprolinase subunit PxpA [Leucobacter massiliensis]PRI11334.1 hypothetical protein B4915_07810 [Leucobacter massiliensis]
MPSIDLNSDLGESFGSYRMGDDAAVLASVSSANIACGFHAGDPRGIRDTCRAAIAAGATIGAHPGYRDLVGFGRRFIEVDPAELRDEVVYQIGALQALARSEGGTVRYVKPHGALYNTIARHEEQAAAVVAAVRDVDAGLPLVVLPGSLVERIARAAGLRTVAEAFADRGYRSDGALVPRGEPGAQLDEETAVHQAIAIARGESIRAQDGEPLRIAADTLCLHGDHPGAVRLAHRIRAAIEGAGIEIRSFA